MYAVKYDSLMPAHVEVLKRVILEDSSIAFLEYLTGLWREVNQEESVLEDIRPMDLRPRTYHTFVQNQGALGTSL